MSPRHLRSSYALKDLRQPPSKELLRRFLEHVHSFFSMFRLLFVKYEPHPVTSTIAWSEEVVLVSVTSAAHFVEDGPHSF